MRSDYTPRMSDRWGQTVVFSPYGVQPPINRKGGILMKLLALVARGVPARVLPWLGERRGALGERVAGLAWEEGLRRWTNGRTVSDRFAPF